MLNNNANTSANKVVLPKDDLSAMSRNLAGDNLGIDAERSFTVVDPSASLSEQEYKKRFAQLGFEFVSMKINYLGSYWDPHDERVITYKVSDLTKKETLSDLRAQRPSDEPPYLKSIPTQLASQLIEKLKLGSFRDTHVATIIQNLVDQESYQGTLTIAGDEDKSQAVKADLVLLGGTFINGIQRSASRFVDNSEHYEATYRIQKPLNPELAEAVKAWVQAQERDAAYRAYERRIQTAIMQVPPVAEVAGTLATLQLSKPVAVDANSALKAALSDIMKAINEKQTNTEIAQKVKAILAGQEKGEYQLTNLIANTMTKIMTDIMLNQNDQSHVNGLVECIKTLEISGASSKMK